MSSCSNVIPSFDFACKEVLSAYPDNFLDKFLIETTQEKAVYRIPNLYQIDFNREELLKKFDNVISTWDYPDEYYTVEIYFKAHLQ